LLLSLLRLKSLSPAPSPKGGGSEYLRLLDATIEELRRVAHHLMPEELLRNGLATALHDFAISVPGAQFQAFGDILREGSAKTVSLTSAEQRILRLICDGKTNPQIAELLQLSTETVRWYRKRLLAKCGVSNTASLVMLAMQEKLV